MLSDALSAIGLPGKTVALYSSDRGLWIGFNNRRFEMIRCRQLDGKVSFSGGVIRDTRPPQRTTIRSGPLGFYYADVVVNDWGLSHRRTTLRLSAAPLIVLFATFPAVAFLMRGRRRRRYRRRHGLCIECGYDLTGNTSGVCPECAEPTSTEKT